MPRPEAAEWGNLADRRRRKEEKGASPERESQGEPPGPTTQGNG